MKASPFFTIALNVSLLTSLLAQTPQQPSRPSPPGEDEVVRVTTNLVQIDAVVTDKNGKPVTDLRPEDFEILEDNKPQPITAFSYVSTDSNSVASANPPAMPIRNAPPLPPTPLRPEQVRRTIVFVVDDLGLSLQSLNAVRSGMKKYVDEQMQPGDLAAIVRTGGGSGALQRLTSDKRQLYAAIENVHWRVSYGNRAGVNLFLPRSDIPMAAAEAMEAGTSQKATLMSLENVLASLKVLPGRKAVLFFTDKFEIFQNPQDLNTSASGRPKPGESSAVSNSSERDVTEYADRITELGHLSNRASVVIYTLAAFGLQYTGPTAAEQSPSGNLATGDPVAQLTSGTWLTNTMNLRSSQLLGTQQVLQELAHETGGFAIINNNDLGKGIGRIMDDLKGYYLIGYRPSDSTFAKRNGRLPYHSITLRLKRPDLHIRSRKGFYGVPDEKQPEVATRTRTDQLVAALESPFVAGAVRLRLTTLFGNVQQGSFVRTLLHVDARDLTFKEMPEGWHQADIDVMASSYGENGLIADYLSRSETIRARGKTYANLLRYGLNYNLLVPIKKPGPYQLRAAVRDAPTDRIGSAYQFIEVPDLKKGRLALSGIALSSAVLDLAALSSASGVYNAPSDNGEEAQPTPAVRRFKPGMLLDYRYVIYNALPGPKNSLPELTAQVRLFRGGELVTSSDQPASDTSRLQFDLKRLSAKGSLRLGDDLIPGNYVLQILVTGPRAKGLASTASQWIDFEVVK